MEERGRHVNTHLKRVVQSFQSTAERSLSGPNILSNQSTIEQANRIVSQKMTEKDVENYHKAMLANTKNSVKKLADAANPFLSPPFPIQQMPLFAPVDTSTSERSDTNLEGETISCFIVGGERRLCLPQILNTILVSFNLQQINAVCEELNIFCSRCNQIQLETLKVSNILPSSAPSCGLITKTDAERLCHALLHHNNPDKSLEPLGPKSFKVYHNCFGKCKGIINPDSYLREDSKCIQCVECYGLFSPSKFVCHSHKSLENRTCHWGFDSSKWRAYLLLAKDQNVKETKLQECIEEVKNRFDPSQKHKRRQSHDISPRNDSKRLKTNSKESSEGVSTPHITSVSSPGDWEDRHALQTTHHWSPAVEAVIKEGILLPAPSIMREGFSSVAPSFLHTGPPVLLNPERVVPYSESQRYERHFTPNVSLAPTANQKVCKEEEVEDEVDRKLCETGTPVPVSWISRDSRDYDLATDTDDSSMASPTESCRDVYLAEAPPYESTLEAEMDLVRSALFGKVEQTNEGRSHFLKSFTRHRAKTEETLQWYFSAYNSMKKELRSVRKRNCELEERTSKMEHCLRSLTLDQEDKKVDLDLSKRYREANSDRRRQIDLLIMERAGYTNPTETEIKKEEITVD